MIALKIILGLIIALGLALFILIEFPKLKKWFTVRVVLRILSWRIKRRAKKDKELKQLAEDIYEFSKNGSLED